MKKSKKLLTIFCLSLALAFTVLPTSNVYADDPQGGSNSGPRPTPPPPPLLTWQQIIAILLAII